MSWDVLLVLQVDAPLFHEIPRVGYGGLSEDEKIRLERKIWEAADAIVGLSSGLAGILESPGRCVG